MKTDTRFKHIAIVTPARESFAWLQQAVLPFALHVSWVHTPIGRNQTGPSFDLVIIDVQTDTLAHQHQLDSLRTQTWPGLPPSVPCVFLLDFPRWQQVWPLLAQGTVRVLNKPVLLPEFEWMLAELAQAEDRACGCHI